MFNTGHQPTVIKSVVESAESGLESADYNADYNADPAKVGVWVWAFLVVITRSTFLICQSAMPL